MLTPPTLTKRISPAWSCIIGPAPLSEPLRRGVCHVLFQTELQICATGFRFARHHLRQVEIGGPAPKVAALRGNRIGGGWLSDGAGIRILDGAQIAPDLRLAPTPHAGSPTRSDGRERVP